MQFETTSGSIAAFSNTVKFRRAENETKLKRKIKIGCKKIKHK